MMTRRPKFKRPPVVEVAISVQFDSPKLDGPQVMLRWSEVRDRFPKYQVAPPLPRSIERYDGPQTPEFEIQFGNTPVTPQLLMMTESSHEALQLQENRIGYTWRKLNREDVYPSYTDIREKFQEELNDFEAYLRRNGLSEFSPIQCELSYVDAILPEVGIWSSHSDLGKIIPSVEPRLNDGFLPKEEEIHYTIAYIIQDEGGHPQGRLRVVVEPRYLAPQQVPMFLMTTTARGAPRGENASAILDTLDIWHDWILRAFVDLTSPEIHQAWGRSA